MLLECSQDIGCHNELHVLLIIAQGDLQEEQCTFSFEVGVLAIILNKNPNLVQRPGKIFGQGRRQPS